MHVTVGAGTDIQHHHPLDLLLHTKRPYLEVAQLRLLHNSIHLIHLLFRLLIRHFLHLLDPVQSKGGTFDGLLQKLILPEIYTHDFRISFLSVYLKCTTV